MRARDIYNGSDGEATRAYYSELMKRGIIGEVAVNLFRASKCSARAKVYRGGIRGKGRYRDMALAQLVSILDQHAAALNITYGWKRDPNQTYHSWVLYIDLPQGQVSFHAASRSKGPDYAGEWDGSHSSADRIIAFCDQVFERPVPMKARELCQIATTDTPN